MSGKIVFKNCLHMCANLHRVEFKWKVIILPETEIIFMMNYFWTVVKWFGKVRDSGLVELRIERRHKLHAILIIAGAFSRWKPGIYKYNVILPVEIRDPARITIRSLSTREVSRSKAVPKRYQARKERRCVIEIGSAHALVRQSVLRRESSNVMNPRRRDSRLSTK